MCSYDPVGLGLPYNHLLFNDTLEPLVEVHTCRTWHLSPVTIYATFDDVESDNRYFILVVSRVLIHKRHAKQLLGVELCNKFFFFHRWHYKS